VTENWQRERVANVCESPAMNTIQETSVGELLKVHGGEIKTGPFGTVLKASEYTKMGVPLISVREVGYGEFIIDGKTPRVDNTVTNRLPQFLLEKDDIVFGRKGAVDRSAIVSADQVGWFLGSDGIRLRLPKAVDAKFVRYQLSSVAAKNWLLQQSTGSTMASLNQRIIERIPLTLPSLAVQQSISSLLGSFDEKIELNRKTNETLEAMAQAIFKDWFVDFGPVRRRMEGASEPSAILGGLLPPDAPNAAEIANLFPDRLADNGLPEGWEERPFSDFVTLVSGGTPKTKEDSYWGGGIPWYSVVDAPSSSDVFVQSTEKTITQAGLDNSSARLVPDSTTIISARGTVGKLAITAGDMTFNQSCYALRATLYASPWLVYLGTSRLIENLQRISHGAVFSTITRQTFDNVYSVNPGPALFGACHGLLEPLFSRIRANVLQIQSLAETRDYLLPRLMSGQVSLGLGRRVA
tara:strand:- start:5927 stop:7327 length:1401 start_codon:yes stop_codon:yes gene_type:complete